VAAAAAAAEVARLLMVRCASQGSARNDRECQYELALLYSKKGMEVLPTTDPNEVFKSVRVQTLKLILINNLKMTGSP
jgi:hypothetical protein